MKFYLTVTLFILLTLDCFANKIDGLKTDKEVASFLSSLDTNFSSNKDAPLAVNTTDAIRKSKNCIAFAGNFGVINWQKADFNNDGLTDLLVNAYWYNFVPLVAIDLGDDKFKMIFITYSSFMGCEIAKTIPSDYGQLLLFRTERPDQSTKKVSYLRSESPSIDTLIYKF